MIEMGDCYKQSVSIWLLRGTKIFNKKIFRCFIEIIFVLTEVICLSLVTFPKQKLTSIWENWKWTFLTVCQAINNQGKNTQKLHVFQSPKQISSLQQKH